MKSRSLIHLTTVLAARVDRADAALGKTLRDAAKVLARKRAGGETNDAAEEQRIARQRTLFSVVPDSQQKTALRNAMLQRAYDLLWDGNSEGCDALTEFLPGDDVQKMLDAWQDDQDPETNIAGKSKWH